jgi:K+-sensing histidine kinase KdpD
VATTNEGGVVGPDEQAPPARFWHQIGPSLRGPQFLLESGAARHIEGFLNQARLVLIGCLLVISNAGLLPGAGEEATLILAGAGIAWAALVATLVYAFYRPWVAIAIALLDVVFVSGLIYLTGGPVSGLDGLYAIIIFAAIIRFTKVHSFLFTAVVILSYVEVVGRHPSFVPELHGNLLMTRAIVLAAAGMLAWFIAMEVERQRRLVVEARQERASLGTIERISRRLAAAPDRASALKTAIDIAEGLAPRAAIAIAVTGPERGPQVAGLGGAWRGREQPLGSVVPAMQREGFGEAQAWQIGAEADQLGELYVGTRTPLREADLALFHRLADDTSVALQRVSLVERERERASTMARLAEQNGRLLEQERDTVSRLRQLSAHKDNFIMMMAHELRTPLTSIRGFAQLLVRAQSATGDGSTYPSVILERSNRMAEIIEDIVDLSRMEKDLLALDRDSTNVPDLLELIRQAASSRGVSVTVSCPDLPPIWADREKLRHALLALIDRAARYRSSDQPIGLSAARDGDDLQLWVEVDADVPAGRLSSIFDETPASTEEPQGGLGIYICKNMVEAHGGNMWLERTEGGSRFGIRLPIEGTGRLRQEPPPDQRLTA